MTCKKCDGNLTFADSDTITSMDFGTGLLVEWFDCEECGAAYHRVDGGKLEEGE